MKTLVCGGRNFSDAKYMASMLNALDPKISILISGAQFQFDKRYERFGADWLAIEWALAMDIPFIGHPAQWYDLNGKFNRKAGFERNTLMLDTWQPERVIAFPGAAGTLDTCKKAEARGIPVIYAGW